MLLVVALVILVVGTYTCFRYQFEVSLKKAILDNKKTITDGSADWEDYSWAEEGIEWWEWIVYIILPPTTASAVSIVLWLLVRSNVRTTLGIILATVFYVAMVVATTIRGVALMRYEAPGVLAPWLLLAARLTAFVAPAVLVEMLAITRLPIPYTAPAVVLGLSLLTVILGVAPIWLAVLAKASSLEPKQPKVASVD